MTLLLPVIHLLCNILLQSATPKAALPESAAWLEKAAIYHFFDEKCCSVSSNMLESAAE